MKIQNVFTKIFYVLLIFVPMLFSVIAGVICLTTGWTNIFEGHDFLYYSIQQPFGSYFGAILILLILFGLGFLTYWGTFKLIDVLNKKKTVSATDSASRKITITDTFIIFCIIFILSFTVRLIPYIFLGDSLQPASDTANIWQFIKGNIVGSVLGHYSFFPAYLNYGLFIKLIVAIFGYKYGYILLANVLTNSVSAALISLLAYQITKSNKIAFVSGAIYSLYLPAILYTLAGTPEHQCILFILIALNCIIASLKSKRTYQTVLLAVVAGLCAAISNSLKSFIPVILVAGVIVFIIYIIGKKPKFTRLAFLALCFVLALAVEVITYNGIMKCSEKFYSIEFSEADAFPHFITVGINREGEGQIHLGSMSRYYITQRENGIPAEEAKASTIELLKTDWSAHKDEIVSFWVKKNIWAWQDEYSSIRVIGYASSYSPSNQFEEWLLSLIQNECATANQIIYILLMGFCSFAAIKQLLKKSNYNMLLLFNNMIIYGFTWLMFILESQSRYKCLILPFICILAATPFDNASTNMANKN